VPNTVRKLTREVIVISDDSEPEFLSKGNGKSKKRAAKQEPSDPFAGNERPAKRHASNPSEIVNVIDLDSDDNSSDNKTKQVHKPNSDVTTCIDNCSDELPRDRDGRYIVTRKVKVDAVEHLDSILRHWPHIFLILRMTLGFQIGMTRESQRVLIHSLKQRYVVITSLVSLANN
jgi:hypothetical protein